MEESEVKTPPHPAKFSDEVLAVMRDEVDSWPIRVVPEYGLKLRIVEPYQILDPFAGVGRVHELELWDRILTWGVELEPEWAATHPRTICGDTLNLATTLGNARKQGLDVPHFFDAIATSPVYGNRMSDHHDAQDDSDRITYRHKLGRELSEQNAGRLQWSGKAGKARYKDFHLKAWRQVMRVLKEDGVFMLNVSDHVRNGAVQPVTRWHRKVLEKMGIEWEREERVQTKRMRKGSNGELRVGYESVLIGRKKGVR